MADDLLQGLKDAIEENEDLGSDPQDTMQKILKMMENVPGLSEEEKENFIKNILTGAGIGTGTNKASQLPLGGPISNPWLEFATLFGLIGFVILLLGLIGYKLYYDAVARERKRELKKLQKGQKKKK